jgi:hypothetical protein
MGPQWTLTGVVSLKVRLRYATHSARFGERGSNELPVPPESNAVRIPIPMFSTQTILRTGIVAKFSTASRQNYILGIDLF